MQDYFGYQGKTVVVTGASSGMGEAAAKMLIDLGAEVHAAGNSKKITYGPAKEYYHNLGSKEELDALIAELPEKIDALFICQGMAQNKENGLMVNAVNFLSDKYLAEALAPRVADNGSITFISSTGGYGWEYVMDTCKEVIDCGSYEETMQWYEAHPEAQANAYVFSKQCLNTYVKYKMFDPLYIDRKIRLNAICPGNTITGLTDAFNRGSSPTGDYEEGKKITEMLFQKRWNGRWASAEEMGWPLVAIGSDIFSYMSGQIIYLDYGMSSAWQVEYGWTKIGG